MLAPSAGEPEIYGRWLMYPNDCRCDSTVSLRGEAAWEYADLHLGFVDEQVPGCVAVYSCPQTGIRWCETRPDDGDVEIHRLPDGPRS